jgi:hypothetical protein
MIFESPDGGKTVFARPPHTVNKVDVTAVTPEDQELNNLWFAWRDILTASKDNPALREALDRAQIIYELSRRDKD